MFLAEKVTAMVVCVTSFIVLLSYLLKTRKKKEPKCVGYVSSLRTYPVKSCGPIFMNEMHVDALGPRHDRQYVLLNDDEKFMTIRRYPKMCLLRPEIHSDCIRIHEDASGDYIDLPLEMTKADGAYTKSIQVFNVTGEAKDGKPRCSFEKEGSPGQAYSSTKDILAFADGCPILIASEASLAMLNEHCNDKVTMERFRPNIVVKGCLANEEQGWEGIQVGSTKLNRLFPCIRCVATTVDPVKGEKDENLHPLKTIERVNPVSSEKWPNFRGPTLGCYYGVVGPGSIRVGDVVCVDE